MPNLCVPAGTTGLLQPLDICVNAPFKSAVKCLAKEGIKENLDDYVQGTIPATSRRVLVTQWVSKAREEVSSDRNMVVRSFKTCGISKDEKNNMKALPDCVGGQQRLI